MCACATGAESAATGRESKRGESVKSGFIYPLEGRATAQCHASTIAESAHGLVAAWFGGSREGKPDVGIWVSRHDGGSWGKPVEVADGVVSPDERHPCWNPVLFQPAQGPLMLFYKVGPSPRAWWGMLTTSEDGGRTWTEPQKLGKGPLGPIAGPIKNKPIQLPDGAIMCPTSTEFEGWRVHFEVTRDLGKTWEVIGPINDGKEFGAIQPSILTYAEGRMQVLCRSKQGVVTQAWSGDGGRTWGPMTASDLPNPNSGTDAVTLRDGRQLIVYNHTGPIPGRWGGKRTPLNIAVSNDGRTWEPALVLEDEPGEYSYPAVIQSSDGMVHVTYTWKRQTVKHVVIDPARFPAPRIEKRPNVILILADDMGLGDLSCLNGDRSRTPSLDRLKAEGLWFGRAYSGSPVCVPARAALLTGRYPQRTGAVTLNTDNYPGLTRLHRDETTMADVFRAGGYRTGLVGKWHLGAGRDYHPLARGFDEFEGFVAGSPANPYVESYFRYRLDIQDRTQTFSDRYLTADLTARAVEFVRRHRDKPFFLHLAHYAPHRPLSAPKERIQPYLEQGLDEKTATVYAMIEIMDEGIGELLAELQRLDLAKDTIVIFTSDNGPDPLAGERFNADLRGTKYTVYEGGIHVPFMIRWPRRFGPGDRDTVVHFTDLLPTLVELCDLTAPRGVRLDGASFAAALTGAEPCLPAQRFWQWNRAEPRYSHNAAVRHGDWKLVRPFVTRNVPKAESDEDPLLYNLASDPRESQDLARKHPKRVASMQSALDAWCQGIERDRLRDSAAVAAATRGHVVHWAGRIDRREADLGLYRIPNTSTLRLYEATAETGSYSHHCHIINHNGRLIATWSNHARGEDEPGQRVLYSASSDGQAWAPFRELLPPLDEMVSDVDETNRRTMCANGFAVVGDRLFGLSEPSIDGGKRIGIGRLACEVNADDTPGPAFWLVDPAPRPLPGFPAYPGAGDAEFADLVTAIKAHTSRPEHGPTWEFLHKTTRPKGIDGRQLCEPTYGYRLEDGAYLRFYRAFGREPRINYAQYSFDDGRTWGAAVPTNFPDGQARSNAGTLPDGTYYVVNSPRNRDPIIISLSDDGLTFDRAGVIRFGVEKKRFTGRWKGPGFQYPSSAVLGDRLFVIHSVNKEDVDITSIPLPELKRIPPFGPDGRP